MTEGEAQTEEQSAEVKTEQNSGDDIKVQGTDSEQDVTQQRQSGGKGDGDASSDEEGDSSGGSSEDDSDDGNVS